jgi:hypothetical protein
MKYLTNFVFYLKKRQIHAGVAELVDAEDSKSSGLYALASSSLAFGTNNIKAFSVFVESLFCFLFFRNNPIATPKKKFDFNLDFNSYIKKAQKHLLSTFYPAK